MMSRSAPFCCYGNPEFGCKFAALPATDQRRAVANRRLDLVYSHAAGELVEELLCCRSIDMRELVANATPLRWRETFWKAKITTTTTTTIVTIAALLVPAESLIPWLWFWVK